MKIIYLPGTRPDLRWFKQYYTSVFSEGKDRADRQFLATQNALKDNPLIGHLSEHSNEVRELHISRTPFSFFYRVKEEHIEVLRVIDKRSDWDIKL